ncbi:MAG: hypothetical protein K2X29_00975 [Candidatus Obscuribacterales bacterium]|nr:hypothetical protein [Candidatus Obscuribacterales bacterium]
MKEKYRRKKDVERYVVTELQDMARMARPIQRQIDEVVDQTFHELCAEIEKGTINPIEALYSCDRAIDMVDDLYDSQMQMWGSLRRSISTSSTNKRGTT